MKTVLTALIVASIVYVLWQMPENKKPGCGCGGQKKDDGGCGCHKKQEQPPVQKIKIIKQEPMQYENDLPYTLPASVLEAYDTTTTSTANSNMPTISFTKPRW